MDAPCVSLHIHQAPIAERWWTGAVINRTNCAQTLICIRDELQWFTFAYLINPLLALNNTQNKARQTSRRRWEIHVIELTCRIVEVGGGDDISTWAFRKSQCSRTLGLFKLHEFTCSTWIERDIRVYYLRFKMKWRVRLSRWDNRRKEWNAVAREPAQLIVWLFIQT